MAKILSKSKEYIAWISMKTRCYNVNYKEYHRYWWRWIRICDNRKTFEWFINDMWYAPFKYSLDRIDNNWNYCKENCRWVNYKKQENNRSNNHLFEFNWLSKTLTDWSELIWISRSTLAQRLYVYKRSIEKTLTT